MIQQRPPGATILLDPNCRPAAVTDLAAYRELIDTFVRQVDVVKVSTDDLRVLRPGEPPLRAARDLLDQGPAAVLVTDGPSPTAVLTEFGERSIPVPAVEVVDTIGAGDAFVAGFLTWWTAHALNQHDAGDSDLLVKAATAAVEVAAADCTVRGANLPAGFRWSTRPGGQPSGRCDPRATPASTAQAAAVSPNAMTPARMSEPWPATAWPRISSAPPADHDGGEQPWNEPQHDDDDAQRVCRVDGKQSPQQVLVDPPAPARGERGAQDGRADNRGEHGRVWVTRAPAPAASATTTATIVTALTPNRTSPGSRQWATRTRAKRPRQQQRARVRSVDVDPQRLAQQARGAVQEKCGDCGRRCVSRMRERLGGGGSCEQRRPAEAGRLSDQRERIAPQDRPLRLPRPGGPCATSNAGRQRGAIGQRRPAIVERERGGGQAGSGLRPSQEHLGTRGTRPAAREQRVVVAARRINARVIGQPEEPASRAIAQPHGPDQTAIERPSEAALIASRAPPATRTTGLARRTRPRDPS